MSKQLFAQKIISKLKEAIGNDGSSFNANTVTQSQIAIAEAITEYIKEHTSVVVNYTGVTPSGAPDPIVADVMMVSGEVEPTSMPVTFELWVEELRLHISTGLQVTEPGQNNKLMTTFNPFNPTPMSMIIPQSALKAAHEGGWEDPQQAVWEVICDGIIKWINSPQGMNPQAVAGVPGSTLASTGMANLIQITII